MVLQLSVSIPSLLAAALGVFVLRRLLLPKPPAPFPPGPKRLPVIGNVLDWPKDRQWEVFTAWRELYGDIVHADIFGQHFIVVNEVQAAIEIFDRKGSIYSNRPNPYFACELVGWKHSPVMLQYGPRFKDTRRVIGEAIGSKDAVRPFGPIQQSGVMAFLRTVLDDNDPDMLKDRLRKMVATVILHVTYGYSPTEGEDPLIKLSERAVAEANEAFLPGRFLVDRFPALRFLPDWLPGAGFKRTAARMAHTREQSMELPYRFTREQIAKGTAEPSLTANRLAVPNLTAYDEDVLKFAAAAVFRGGADTTVSVLYTFFLAMTLHPEVQERGRAEIDAVVGKGRVPTASDRDALPYVDAICKESMRWGYAAPTGLPHALKEDDIHAGYFIPKGSIVLANIGGMTHDERVYSNPSVFNPARFLATDGHEPELDPKSVFFGFGRRVCPGATLADSNIFIAIAMILACLDIQKPIGDQGNVIEPTVRYASGTLSKPEPFKCSVKACSKEAEDMIRLATDGPTQS